MIYTYGNWSNDPLAETSAEFQGFKIFISNFKSLFLETCDVSNTKGLTPLCHWQC